MALRIRLSAGAEFECGLWERIELGYKGLQEPWACDWVESLTT